MVVAVVVVVVVVVAVVVVAFPHLRAFWENVQPFPAFFLVFFF